VPKEMSVVRPASHCPGCSKPIAGYDNVPVVSYVLLRGRARCCGARMSPRYPIVELIGGALSLAILELVVMKMPGSSSAARALAGAWFGWPGVLVAVVGAAFEATLYAAALRALGVTPKLPDAVVADLEQLRKDAEAGDEEAKRELEHDPLAEEYDPFIIRWFV